MVLTSVTVLNSHNRTTTATLRTEERGRYRKLAALGRQGCDMIHFFLRGKGRGVQGRLQIDLSNIMLTDISL